MAVEVSFPIKNGGLFHSYVNVYQRVTRAHGGLPGATRIISWDRKVEQLSPGRKEKAPCCFGNGLVLCIAQIWFLVVCHGVSENRYPQNAVKSFHVCYHHSSL